VTVCESCARRVRPKQTEALVEASELAPLAQDIGYEMRLLRYAAEQMHVLPPKTDAYNTMVECFLLHTRNLVAFFDRPVPTEGDDVVVGHYLPEWDRYKDGGHEMKYLRKVAPTVNKRVAHLTAYRVRVPQSQDARLVVDVRQAAEGVWHRFLSRLPLPISTAVTSRSGDNPLGLPLAP
jgi:hypothetical protein